MSAPAAPGGRAEPLFRIVQLEVAGELEPQEGRWTLRGHANRPIAVVVVDTTPRPRRRFGRERRVPDAPPLLATRLTVIDAEPLDVADPVRWLAEADGEAALREALRLVRRLLHLRAVAAAEPDPRPVRPRDLTLASIAYGTGAEGAYGRWTSSRRLKLPGDRAAHVRRSGRGTGADARLADLLSGRDAALAAEVLTLRARQDLAAGRTREAALQVRVALEAAIAELEPWRDVPHVDEALDGLRDARPTVATTATAALRGGLDADQVADVEAILTQLTVALERRAGGRRVGEDAHRTPRTA